MGDETSNFFEKLGKLYQSDLLILIDAACIAVGWYFKIWVPMLAALAAVNIAPLFFSRETKHLISFLMMFSLIISTNRHQLKDFAPLLAIVPVLLAGMLFNMIYFRRSLSALSPKRIKGFNFTMLLIFIPVALGGVMSPYEHPLAIAVAAALFLVFGLGYCFFTVTNCDSESRKTIADYVLKTLFAMGLIILMQMSIYFAGYGSLDAIIESMKLKLIMLGWAGPNNVAPTLSMCIVATLYLCVKKSWLTPIYTVVALIEYVALFTTGCRGAILVTTVAMPAMLFYVVVKSENRIAFGITVCVVFTAAIGAIALFGDKVTEVLSYIIDKGLNSSGRTSGLYPEAIGVFKRWPIFGAGWDYRLGELAKDGYSPYWFHSTALQIAANMGIVGIVFFALFYFMRYRTFFIGRKNPSTVALMAATFLFDAYGMLDTNFFGPTFFLMLLALTFAVEIGFDENQGLMFPFLTRRKRTKKAVAPEGSEEHEEQDIAVLPQIED